jgi:hypothetical protein
MEAALIRPAGRPGRMVVLRARGGKRRKRCKETNALDSALSKDVPSLTLPRP